MAEDLFPPSFAQERIWFLTQFLPDLPVYSLNIHLTLDELGPVDPDRLSRAFHALVSRHEALRTSFTMENGELVQVVTADIPIDLPITDLSDRPEVELRQDFERIAAAEAATRIALDRPPLWRARLVRLRHDDWRLLFSVHHTIFDAWSGNVFNRELSEIYAALEGDREPRLPELAVQYADYAVWQRGRIAGGDQDADLTFWRERLAGLPADLGIPTDRPRPAVFSHLGDVHEFSIPAEVTARIEVLAKQMGATPFMVMLAAFKVLLWRWAGHPDIVVGCPVSGRDLPELDPLVGMFVNTLVLRTDVGGDPTFRALVGRVRTTTTDALDHQNVPFERLVQALQPPRDPSRTPLYQIGFNQIMVEARGRYGNGTTQTDLNLELHNPRGQVAGWVQYSTDLFDAATIRQLVSCYLTLLRAVAETPDVPISRLPLLGDEDRRLLLAKGHGTVAGYPQQRIDELVAAQAVRSPDATAIVHGEVSLTYRGLEARACALAGRLHMMGVGNESPVAVYLPREPSVIVALLAVLKAGGCYVPLDPDYPPERLRYMLADSRAGLVLTNSRLAAGLPVDSPRVMTLDTTALDDDPADSPAATESPDGLAYMIYTSGSTGRPKGVMVPHRGVVNLIWDLAREPGFSAPDRMLFLTSLSFDISALELFAPLVTGGTVVIAEQSSAHAAGEMRALIEREGVTTVQGPPSVLEVLLRDLPPGLSRIFSGGEPLPPQLASRILDRVGELWNLYGPTETTIWSCKHRVPRAVTTMSIGSPVANTAAHVLDEALEPTPIGVPGELYLGGTAALARGYHDRPATTAERFIPDPHSDRPGSRMYRTGDLVRRRADGALEFLGRNDDQVKVRGVRVELGEVETTLQGHPKVRKAVASVRQDAPGGPALVAYVDWAGEPDVVAHELRSHLSARLPQAMLPSVYVSIRDFPSLPNGKLNRAALPPPTDERIGLPPRYVPPTTASEELVASIWAEVLGRDRIGADDDFFELGGHSLLAVKVAARIRAEIELDVPLRDLFTARTVRLLAATVEERLAEEIDRLSDDEAERLVADTQSG